MEVGDIVAVNTPVGEYVGELISFEGDVILKKPRLILFNPDDGKMGFAKGISIASEENPEEVVFRTFTFTTTCNQDIVNAYEQYNSSLIVPKSKKIVV